MKAVIVMTLLTGLCVGSEPATISPARSTASEELQQEKLREEIRKLELENYNAVGVRGFFRLYAPFLTGIAAIGGVLVTISKQTREHARQQAEDRKQREEQSREQALQRTRDRDQRQSENRQRLEEKFSTILTSLGSDSEAVQAGAAVSLLSFLRPEHAEYHSQVRLVTLSNLKVNHPEAILKLLVRVFEAAMRTPKTLDPLELDFSDAKLYGVDLSKLSLNEVDIDSTDLRNANLTDTRLRRASGYRVDLTKARLNDADLDAARLLEAQCSRAVFYDARLHAVHLERANCQEARFQRAGLQSAHFDEADLKGAQFQEADLNDAYFTDAQLDEVALKSIVRAYNWRKAHYSDDVLARLKQLAGD